MAKNKKEIASKGVSVEDAKKNMQWKIIPLSQLPDNVPVIGIVNYPSKSFAEFHMCEEVIVPVFAESDK